MSLCLAVRAVPSELILWGVVSSSSSSLHCALSLDAAVLPMFRAVFALTVRTVVLAFGLLIDASGRCGGVRCSRWWRCRDDAGLLVEAAAAAGIKAVLHVSSIAAADHLRPQVLRNEGSIRQQREKQRKIKAAAGRTSRVRYDTLLLHRRSRDLSCVQSAWFPHLSGQPKG